jgi:hypothetical protein
MAAEKHLLPKIKHKDKLYAGFNVSKETMSKAIKGISAK